MKKFFLSFILTVILVILVINYFSPVLLADSASCSSGDCSCSCTGAFCWCIAQLGHCSCNCSDGGGSKCGGKSGEIEQN